MTEKTLGMNSNILYALGMSQPLHFAIKIDFTESLEKILSPADNSDTGYVLKVELSF